MSEELEKKIALLVKPYLENCCGLARDGYDKVDGWSKSIAEEVIKIIRR